MLERAIIAIALLIVVAACALAVRAIARRRASAAVGSVLPDELRARLPESVPGIVYFYGPHCGTCRQQAAILDQFATERRVPVVRVDAAREPSIADALGVMMVPTTIVVDSASTIRSTNFGFQPEPVLATQLGDIA